MKPQRILLIRHAESEGNVDRIVHATVPDWKIPLTAKGREHARETGLKLQSILNEPTAFYVSPYLWTKQTFDEIASQFLYRIHSVKEDPRLVEQAWGNLRAYEPRKWAEVEAERDAYGPFYYRFLHGEGGVEVYQRCAGFLETLYRDFEKPAFPNTVVIVTHGFTLRILLMRWLHWSVEEFHSLRNPRNCQTFELRLDSTGHYQLTEPFPKHT